MQWFRVTWQSTPHTPLGIEPLAPTLFDTQVIAVDAAAARAAVASNFRAFSTHEAEILQVEALGRGGD